MTDFHCFVSGNFIHGNILETNDHDFRTSENHKTKKENYFELLSLEKIMHHIFDMVSILSHYFERFIMFHTCQVVIQQVSFHQP